VKNPSPISFCDMVVGSLICSFWLSFVCRLVGTSWKKNHGCSSPIQPRDHQGHVGGGSFCHSNTNYQMPGGRRISSSASSGVITSSLSSWSN
jgi:hypothetical protein